MKTLRLVASLLLTIAASASAQDKAAKLDEAINTYVSQEKFTGTVLIASHGKIILEKGYGLRDAATNAPNTVQTVYQLASIAKTFTAAVVLKLAEQGKLSLADKLSKYYPGYPNGDRITIRQLLSHTAGVFDYTKSQKLQQSDQSKPVLLDSMISIFKDKPLDFEPGTKFSYSNSGYTLLGYIIEKITGKPYRQVLENMILKPLALNQSGYDFISLKDVNKATGYNIYAAGNYQPATYVHPSILYTTGALYSTVGDLYKWHQALQTNKLLTVASTMEMYTPVKGPYGYGWFTDSLFGKKRVSHDGSVSGFKTNINRMPDDNLCIIALSNSGTSRVGEMVRVLVSLFYDQPYKLPVERKNLQLSIDSLKQFVGIYQFSPQTSLTVNLEGTHLFVKGTGLPKVELFAEAPLSFFGKAMDLKIEFEKAGSTGVISQMFFYQGKQKLPGKKIR